MGERVRWDGRDKLSPDLVADLATWAQVLPVCPEVEMGLPVPREALELREERRIGARMIGRESGSDRTPAMEAFCTTRFADPGFRGLAGYVLKSRSPSCGLRGVPVVEEGGARRPGLGLFAAALRAAFPTLPLVEEGQVATSGARARFRWRVELQAAWSAFAARQPDASALVALHRAQRPLRRLLLPPEANRLDRAAAAATADRLDRYGALLLSLARVVSVRRA